MPEKDNVHKGHRQRMWKRYMEQGIDSFEEHELLEMMLYSAYSRRNTNDIAHELIRYFGGISGVLTADFDNLCDVPDVGPSAATQICFIRDMMSKYANTDYRGIILNTSDKTREFCHSLLKGMKVEVAHALFLDSTMALVHQCRLSRGNSTSVEFDLKSIAEKAIRNRCEYVVLIHNHPSGAVLPSSADIATTRRTATTLLNIGITLSDHVIVSENDAYSMRASGHLQDIWI